MTTEHPMTIESMKIRKAYSELLEALVGEIQVMITALSDAPADALWIVSKTVDSDAMAVMDTTLSLYMTVIAREERWSLEEMQEATDAIPDMPSAVDKVAKSFLERFPDPNDN